MEVSNDLPDNSRVWVYQSDVEFSADQLKIVAEKLNWFINEWAAHGTQLNAAAEIFHNRFIVLFVDESGQNATGCSIDKSVAFIKSIEKELSIELMNRLNIAYELNGVIFSAKMADFQAKIKEGIITSDTIVFNNLVQNKSEFISKWKVPVKESWHQNLLVK